MSTREYEYRLRHNPTGRTVCVFVDGDEVRPGWGWSDLFRWSDYEADALAAIRGRRGQFRSVDTSPSRATLIAPGEVPAVPEEAPNR